MIHFVTPVWTYFGAVFFPTPVGTPGGKPLRLTARVKIARARPDRFWPAEPFFRDTLVITTTGLPPPRPHHLTATHVLRIGHSHSGSTHAFAPLRGVATRESSATSSRYRTYEGVAPLAPPRRAHYRRRAGCLQPENSGPFVLATAPIISPCGPGFSL